MDKNYNFNYENRSNRQKSSIEFGNVEVASCKSDVLKKSQIYNGRVWHTTDTNEFYFDWDGKRTKMNITGESSNITNEINKIKSDVAKLNPENLDALERKVNQAVSTVNELKGDVESVISDVQNAVQAAQDSAAAVAGKADVSYVDEAVANAFSNLTAEQKEELKGDTGQDGQNGLSAYELAVNNGYNGTLEDWLNTLKGEDGEGLSDEDRAKIDSIPDEGKLPQLDAEGNVVSGTSTSGYATIDDIVSYVNELVSKKKVDDGDSDVPVSNYAYITGYREGSTPTDITVFNPYLLNDTGDTEIEVLSSQEISTFNPEDFEYLPSVKFTVDVPVGYTIKEAYIWNDILEEYELLNNDHRAFGVNPRYATRTISGVTYNSYVRGPVNEDVASPAEKYKLIITKQ